MTYYPSKMASSLVCKSGEYDCTVVHLTSFRFNRQHGTEDLLWELMANV